MTITHIGTWTEISLFPAATPWLDNLLLGLKSLLVSFDKKPLSPSPQWEDTSIRLTILRQESMLNPSVFRSLSGSRRKEKHSYLGNYFFQIDSID